MQLVSSDTEKVGSDEKEMSCSECIHLDISKMLEPCKSCVAYSHWIDRGE